MVYFAGTGALFVFDLWASRQLGEQELAEWAFTRSAVFIGAVLLTGGVDQAVIRADINWSDLLRGACAQSFFGGVAIFALLLGVASPVLAGLCAVSAAFLSLLAVISGKLRANFQISRAHVVFQLWKVGLLAAWLLLGLTQPARILVIVLGVWVSCSVAWIVRSSNGQLDSSPGEYSRFSELRPVGRRFWVASSVAAGMQFLDQLILNVSGSTEASAIYFRHTALLASVGFFATGFAAQLLNPWIRSKGDAIRKLGGRIGLIWLIGGLCIAAGSIGIGLFANQFVVVLPAVDGLLVALLLALLFVRFAYLMPSGVVGVLGTKDELTRMVAASSLALAAFPALFSILLWSGLSAEHAVGVAALLSALLRAVAASFVLRGLLASERELSLTLT